MKRFGIPIGVIEIKKPGNNVMTSKKTFGQLYDHMLSMRKMYGMCHVFGILTSYDKWKVCWLNDDICQHTDYSSPINDFDLIRDQIENSLKNLPLPCLNEQQMPLESNEDSVLVNDQKRILYTTKAYSCEDPALVQLLAQTLWKMAKSPMHPPDPINLNETKIMLKQDVWKWGKPQADRLKLLAKLPHVNVKNYFILKDLHGGAHGRVWLACSNDGTAVVIKFPKDGVDIQQECNNWHKIYGPNWSRISVLNGKSALIMPFFKPVSPDEINDPIVIEAVKSIIQDWINKGFEHNDLSHDWRHVGLYSDIDGKVKAILTDLTNCSEANSESQKRMMDALSI